MDRKTIIAVGICLASLFLVQVVIVPKLFPPIKVPITATNAVTQVGSPALTNQTASNAAIVAAGSNVATATSAATARAAAIVSAFDTNTPEQLLVLTNENARYTFTSRGGGLKLAELVRYPETVSALRKKKVTVIQDLATLNESMPLPVGALLDDGTTAGDGIFQLTTTATGVRAEKVLTNGLSIVKEFSLGTNYLIAASARLENHGAQPLVLPAREWVIGAATPLGSHDNGQFVGVMWYDGAKADETANQAWFDNHSFMSCVTHSSNPRFEYQGGSNNVVWASAHNQFFTMAGMPESPVAGVAVRPVKLPRDPDLPADKPTPQGFQTALVYAAATLPPGGFVEQRMNLFVGPKEYSTLAAVSERFNNNVDLVMGYGGFFGGFARVLLLAMNWLHDVLRLPYGWAIIAITFIIKTVFWPLTAASTRSMKRMSAMQPQMNAIKEKYKDDPAKMNKKTMEFMKEHKINPIGGCLPMVIQLPIFIGFYRMIQSAIELRGAPFLWIGDLSNPDTLFIIPGLGMFPVIGIPGVGLPINLLPLIMGATQIWQIRLTPPSPGMDASQQKMMRWMPLMFIVILYNFSAGLTLYWTVQNLLSIVQTKLTKTVPEAAVVVVPPQKKK